MKFCGGEDVCVDLVVMTLCRSVPWRYLHYTPSQHWRLLVRFWSSHSGVADDSDLVGCDTGIWWVVAHVRKDCIALNLRIKQTLLGLFGSEGKGTVVL